MFLNPIYHLSVSMDHKLSTVEPSQFLCSRSPKTEIKVLAGLCSLLEALRDHIPPSPLTVLPESSFSWL